MKKNQQEVCLSVSLSLFIFSFTFVYVFWGIISDPDCLLAATNRHAVKEEHFNGQLGSHRERELYALGGRRM